MIYFLNYKNVTFVTLQMIIRCILVAKGRQTVIENLTYDVKDVLTRFKIISMKANPDRFQFLIVSKTRCQGYNLLMDSNVIIKSAGLELVGLIVDNKLSFEKHIVKLCQAGSYKPMHSSQRKLEDARALQNAFVDSQFNYTPLIWMVYKRTIFSKCRKFITKH